MRVRAAAAFLASEATFLAGAGAGVEAAAGAVPATNVRVV